jgi:hypothetical protein
MTGEVCAVRCRCAYQLLGGYLSLPTVNCSLSLQAPPAVLQPTIKKSRPVSGSSTLTGGSNGMAVLSKIAPAKHGSSLARLGDFSVKRWREREREREREKEREVLCLCMHGHLSPHIFPYIFRVADSSTSLLTLGSTQAARGGGKREAYVPSDQIMQQQPSFKLTVAEILRWEKQSGTHARLLVLLSSFALSSSLLVLLSGSLLALLSSFALLLSSSLLRNIVVVLIAVRPAGKQWHHLSRLEKEREIATMRENALRIQ